MNNSSDNNNTNVTSTSPDDSSYVDTSGIALKKATTTFVDDNIVTKRDETYVSHINKSLINYSDLQMKEQSVIDFLAKPIVLSSGTFSVSDTYSFFNSIAMPYGAFTSAQAAVWNEKLKGYFGIRMDMRFRLVINANRFQAGRYCIGWTPLAGMKATTSNLKELTINNMHNATLVQRTTIPHVEIDINTGTSAELLVPFVSVGAFYPLNAIWGAQPLTHLGFINVYPYYPLIAPTGNTTCGYTLYVSFENVSLIGAASPQSGLSASDKEVANTLNGPISGVAASFSRGFKEFSDIPLIGSYANKVSWIADRIAVTAKIFGYSKPTQGDGVVKMSIHTSANHSNIDGDSEVKSLGLQSKTATMNIDGLSGTAYDEMDFSYILRKYAWFTTYTWSTSDVVGNLVKFDVNPSSLFYTAGGAAHYPPVSFISKYFQLWRGSVKYRFKIVKTEFHSGRISVAFYPTDELTGYTNGDYYVNRMIIDIRETSTFEIIVPYIARTPWLVNGAYPGVIGINVVDPLVAPSTVTSSVKILMEIAGGDDYEVAVPSSYQAMPVPIVPQSGLTDDQGFFTSTIGSSTVTSDPLVHTSFTIGEKVTSLRSYLKRYHPITKVSGITDTTFNATVISLNPDVIIAATNGTYATGYVAPDPYSVFSCCFAMVSGGIRIKDTIAPGIISAATPLNWASSSISSLLETGDPPSITNFLGTGVTLSSKSSNLPIAYQQLNLNNTLSVEIPQYTQSFARAKGDILLLQTATPTSATTYTGGSGTSGSKTRLHLIAPYNVSQTLDTAITAFTLHNVYRSVSDDFCLHTFISVPPVTNVSAGVSPGFC